MVKESDCKLEVSEFELQSHNNVYFLINKLDKGIEPPYPPHGLKISSLFFAKDSIGIKEPVRVDMPWNK